MAWWRGVDRRILFLLVAAQFSAFVDRNLTSAMAPQIKAAYRLSDTQLGALQGPIFVGLYVAGIFAAGFFASHRGRLRIIAGCIALWTAGSIVMALAPGIGALIAGRLLLGLGQSSFAPCVLAVFADRAIGERRARALSHYTAASSVGRSAAFIIAGLVLAGVTLTPLAGNEAWRAATLIMVAPNLLLILGLAASPVEDRVTRAPSYRAALEWIWSRRGASACIILGASAAVMTVQTLTAWGAPLLQRNFAIPPELAALGFGLALVPAALMGHLGGAVLIDRLAGRRAPPLAVLAAALVFALIATLAAALAPGPISSGAALALAILGGSLASLAGLTAMQAICPPDRRGAVGAVFLGVTSLLGFGLGPLTAGLLSDRRGGRGEALSQGLVLVVVGAALVAIVALMAGRRAWREAMTEAAFVNG